MAVPTNITPATARVITSLPFSETLDISEAPDSDAMYEASCADDLAHGVWWVYTPPVGITAIGLRFASETVSDLYPLVSVWTGTPPALTQTAGHCWLPGPASDAEGTMQLNVTPGIAHYFQVTDAGGGVPPGIGNLVFELEPVIAEEVPAGSLVVSNDFANFPTTFLAESNLDILLTIGFPAFEQMAMLPSGIFAVLAETDDGEFNAHAYNIYGADFQLLHELTGLVVSPTQSVISPLSVNGAGDTFYAVRASASPVAFQETVITFNAAGVQGPTTWTMPSTPTYSTSAGCVSSDETIMYRAGGTTALGRGVSRYDLINDTPLSPLVALTGSISSLGRDMLRLPDETFLMVLVVPFVGTLVRRYDTAGATVMDYPIPTTVGSTPRIALGIDPSTFWIMSFPTSGSFSVQGTSRFQNIRVSDGVELFNQVRSQKSPTRPVTPMFGPAQSCPLFLNLVAVSPTPPEPPDVPPTICPVANSFGTTLT